MYPAQSACYVSFSQQTEMVLLNVAEAFVCGGVRNVEQVTDCTAEEYRGADKSLARSTSPCNLFDNENILFDASLYIYIYIYTHKGSREECARFRENVP